jgi:hypothetical protein
MSKAGKQTEIQKNIMTCSLPQEGIQVSKVISELTCPVKRSELQDAENYYYYYERRKSHRG